MGPTTPDKTFITLPDNEKLQNPVRPCDHYAGSEKFLEKALILQEQMGEAFDITIDMEDGAARTNKIVLARNLIETAKNFKNPSKRLGLRLPEVNNLQFEEIANLFIGQLDFDLSHITVSKTSNYPEFLVAKEILLSISRTNNTILPPLHVLIETNEVMDDISKITNDPNVKSLEIGVMDFISSFNGAIPMNECEGCNEFDNPIINQLKTVVILEAAKKRITPVHNISREYQKTDLLKNFCLNVKKLGFPRMWSIHPAQIPIIVEILTPDKNEIITAIKILEKARDHDWGPVSYDNKLHDFASYRYYAGILLRAKTLGREVPEGTNALLENMNE
ncbi:MAG TPA: hypothetical protein PKA63_13335 [Oligoflexia bacterium]|nr:hypothetical protein [Oligoflexia bacterium]HMP49644.1 hypothetical protein [Oligoflexia bacterium]